MREHDVTVGTENIFAELMDLQASGAVGTDLDAFAIIGRLREQYENLWSR